MNMLSRSASGKALAASAEIDTKEAVSESFVVFDADRNTSGSVRRVKGRTSQIGFQGSSRGKEFSIEC